MPATALRPVIAYAATTTAAALIALLASLYFDLPNPGWSALTVFVASQPLGGTSGSVAARARYRVAGTFVGMVLSLVIVPAFAGSPELLIAATGAWLGLCVYVALLDRGPRSYLFLLAGYTVALVGIPLAGDPGALFDTAVWRTEEIGLGAVCAIVVHGLVPSRSPRDAMAGRLVTTLVDARRWMLDALAFEPVAADEARTRHRIAADLTELRTHAANVRFEAGASAAGMRVVMALEHRLVALLPLMTAVEDRLAGLAGAWISLPALHVYILQVRAWIADERPDALATTSALLAAGARALPAPGSVAPNLELLATSAVERIAQLVTAWDECLVLADAARDARAATSERVTTLSAGATARPLHVDHGMAAFSGLAAAVSVFAAAAICWFTGWQQGGAAIGLAAASSAVFAFLDDPRPLQRFMFTWSAAAVPIGALYLFAILPRVQDVATLCLALLPLFLGTAFFLGIPRHSIRALAFALISQTLIALQPTMRADFDTFTTLSISLVLGTLIALVTSGLIRVVGADLSSRRILSAGWRELQGLADGSRPQTATAWTSRMIDRVGLLLPRLARATGDERLRLANALRDLRLGIGISELREMAPAAGQRAREALDTVMAGLARHVQAQAQPRQQAETADSTLLRSVDRLIAQLLALGPGAPRTKGLTAAAGLRRNLFPDAPAYTPPEDA